MSATEQQLLKDMNFMFENFKVTLQDLRNPTEEFVRNFYCYYLSEFEVDPNNVEQMHFSQNVGVVYQDAYSGLIPKLNLMRAIKVLNVIPDFGLSDIINPSPKRTQQVIRALLNFYSWADSNVASLIGKRKELNYSERRKKLTELLEIKEHLREKLNNTSREMGQLQMEKAKHKEEFDKTTEQHAKLILEKEVAKKEMEMPVSMNKEKENAVNKLDKEITQVQNLMKECSNQIIDSPTVILGDLKSLREKQQELMKTRDEKRDNVESKMKTHKTVRQGLEDQIQRAEELKEVLKLIDELKGSLKKLKTAEKSVDKQQDSLNELMSILEKTKKDKEDQNKSLEEFVKKDANILSDLKQRLEIIKSEISEKKNNKKNFLERMNDVGAIQLRIQAELDSLKNLNTSFMAEFNRLKNVEIEEVERRIAVYQAEIEYLDEFKDDDDESTDDDDDDELLS